MTKGSATGSAAAGSAATDGSAVRRLFVAVDPPAAAVADLSTVVDELAVTRANAPGASTRVVPPDRWHVTVVFLGEVAATQLDVAGAALDRACESDAVRAALPISLQFAGGGTFGRGRFTILWARIAGDVAALRTLSSVLRRELRRAHLPFDDKPFRPHLTLARPGNRVAADLVAADVLRLDGHSGPSWPVDAVHLVESDFRTLPTGVVPRYTRIHSVAV